MPHQGFISKDSAFVVARASAADEPSPVEKATRSSYKEFKKCERSAVPSFPTKLHYILSELDRDGRLLHVARWAPHGHCFYIHDREQFVEKVLRLWFTLTKFTSFQRQLGLYGFKRITRGVDEGGFYHELFLRGRPSLAATIPRTQIKCIVPGQSREKRSEPDYYRYEATNLLAGPQLGYLTHNSSEGIYEPAEIEKRPVTSTHIGTSGSGPDLPSTRTLLQQPTLIDSPLSLPPHGLDNLTVNRSATDPHSIAVANWRISGPSRGSMLESGPWFSDDPLLQYLRQMTQLERSIRLEQQQHDILSALLNSGR